MGAGRGGGTSGISTTGSGLRGLEMMILGALAAAILRAFTGRVGFARRAFATGALPRFTFVAFSAFRPAFLDECAFAMTAYATVGARRRQQRRGVLNCCHGDFTLGRRRARAHRTDPMLDLTTTNALPTDIDAELLVLAVRDDELEHGDLLADTDARVGGVLKRATGEERFRGKLGQTLIVHVRDVRARRIALVGLGAGAERAGQSLRIAAGCAARIAAGVGATRVALAWSLPPASAND